MERQLSKDYQLPTPTFYLKLLGKNDVVIRLWQTNFLRNTPNLWCRNTLNCLYVTHLFKIRKKYVINQLKNSINLNAFKKITWFVPNYLPFFTCLTRLHFLTCLICLHFLRALWCLHLFTCFTCLHFFTYLSFNYMFSLFLDAFIIFTCPYLC